MPPCAAPSDGENGPHALGAIFKIDPHAAGAAPSDGENGHAPIAIFKIDPHAACAAPSEDENEPRTKRYFQESQQMLYYVQQKLGDKPYLRLKVALCTTFWTMFPGLRPIPTKLLHKIQHYPSDCTKNAENVAFFAGFVASCARVCPGRGSDNAESEHSCEVRMLTRSSRPNGSEYPIRDC
jgi:hypothetical protein